MTNPGLTPERIPGSYTLNAIAAEAPRGPIPSILKLYKSDDGCWPHWGDWGPQGLYDFVIQIIQKI